MKPSEVHRRVAAIAGYAGDDEKAHGLEDQLFVDVLEAIAAGHANPEALAREALKSRQINFERWTA